MLLLVHGGSLGGVRWPGGCVAWGLVGALFEVQETCIGKPRLRAASAALWNPSIIGWPLQYHTFLVLLGDCQRIGPGRS